MAPQRHSVRRRTGGAGAGGAGSGLRPVYRCTGRLESLPTRLRRHPTFACLAAPEWVEAAARSGQPHRAAARWRPSANRRQPTGTARSAQANLHPLPRTARVLTAMPKATSRRRSGCTDEVEPADGSGAHRIALRRVASPGAATIRSPRAVARGAAWYSRLVGARSWAERARAELRATGETVAAAGHRAEARPVDPAGATGGASGADRAEQPGHRRAACSSVPEPSATTCTRRFPNWESPGDTSWPHSTWPEYSHLTDSVGVPTRSSWTV